MHKTLTLLACSFVLKRVKRMRMIKQKRHHTHTRSTAHKCTKIKTLRSMGRKSEENNNLMPKSMNLKTKVSSSRYTFFLSLFLHGSPPLSLCLCRHYVSAMCVAYALVFVAFCLSPSYSFFLFFFFFSSFVW